MEKLTDIILAPPTESAPGPHPEPEDLARLAEGGMAGPERERVVEHLNRCEECYQVFSGALLELETERGQGQAWWSRHARQITALAACFMAAVFLGLGAWFYLGPDEQQALRASLPLDGGLKKIMAQAPESGKLPEDLARRLIRELKKRKIEVREPKKVMMLAAYFPSKSLFGPEEILKIKIEKGVMYLEVVEKK